MMVDLSSISFGALGAARQVARFGCKRLARIVWRDYENNDLPQENVFDGVLDFTVLTCSPGIRARAEEERVAGPVNRFHVVVGVIFLFIMFVATRFVIIRYTGHSTVANITGAALVAAFVLGSVARTFQLPVPQPVAANPAPAGAAATPAAAAQAGAARKCIGLTGMPGAGGVGAFDQLETDVGAVAVHPNAEIAQDAQYVALGWGADRDRKLPALGVCLLVDGKPARRSIATYGFDRPDVAQAFGPALGPTGFKIVIPPNALAKGPHNLAVAVESDDGSFALAPNTLDIVIR